MLKLVVRMIDGIIVLIAVGVLLLAAPGAAGYKPFAVLSGSMEPAIRTGAVAYVDTGVSGADVGIGDIVAFRSGNILVTHRIVGLDDDGRYVTKGDANQTEDFAPVEASQIIGRTVFSVPYAGYAVTFLKGKGVFYLVGMLLSLRVIFTILAELATESNLSKKREHT